MIQTADRACCVLCLLCTFEQSTCTCLWLYTHLIYCMNVIYSMTDMQLWITFIYLSVQRISRINIAPREEGETGSPVCIAEWLFTAVGIYVLYHCVSMCMFVQWVGTDNRPLSLCILFFSCGLTQTFIHTNTHTPHLHTQFLLASVKLQQFRDSKTGTIWSSLPASHFLPSPSAALIEWQREKERDRDELKGKIKSEDGWKENYAEADIRIPGWGWQRQMWIVQ